MRSITFFAITLVFASVTALAESNPVPLIYQPLRPASVTPGHATFALTVNGTGFVPGAVVRWNGKPLRTKFISSSAVKALVPGQAVAKASTGVGDRGESRQHSLQRGVFSRPEQCVNGSGKN